MKIEPQGRRTVTGTLRVEYNGPVATIVLDNPRRRNAMTKEMWQQFQPLLDLLAADQSVKVVVVRGAAENFSAGADISDLKDILHDPGTGRHDGGHVTAGENALASFHKPTIAAIDGYCIGGGWQIAGACDIRIASDRSTFGITPSKVGIIYPLSGIERLVRLAGPATAKYLLFSGDFISATEAISLGLLARVVPQSDFWAEITAFAERLASRSQLSIQAMKDIIDVIAEDGDGLGETNAAWQREMALSGEPEIGVEAFLTKQTPQFKWSGRDSRLFEL
jgi:enoyl-CoA hydratase/carnithine racemase